jgi:hypothetical protein
MLELVHAQQREAVTLYNAVVLDFFAAALTGRSDDEVAVVPVFKLLPKLVVILD